MTTRSSLVVRLTVWYAALSFILVSATTAYLYWSVSQTLTNTAESLLTDKLQTVRLLCQATPFEFARLKGRIEREWPATQLERVYVEVRGADGTVLAATPGEAPGLDSRRLTSRVTAPSLPGGAADVVIMAAKGAETALLAKYRARILWVLAGALLVGIAVGRGIARRGVAPIAKISRVATRINASSLSERLDARGFPVEMAALTVTFNAMLDRLEEGFKRLSQFSADISHELKTPISNVAGEVEVALSKSRPEEYYKDLCGSVLEECERVKRIVDSLLFLAQCDSPHLEIVKEHLDIGVELANIVEFYEPAAAEQHLKIALDAPVSVLVSVERTLFQRAVGNLLTNAIKQTQAEGRIDVRLTAAPDQSVAIEIQDNGKGIASEHLPYVFDRFYRVDGSRSKGSGGVGLGLAIVRSIARVHGGSVSIESALGRGTLVRLELPSA